MYLRAVFIYKVAFVAGVIYVLLENIDILHDYDCKNIITIYLSVAPFFAALIKGRLFV